MPNERLLVVGAGAQARFVLNTVRLLGDIEIVGLVDVFDNPSIWGKEIDGALVLGSLEEVEKYPPDRNLTVTVAVGDPHRRRSLVEELAALGHAFRTVAHPRACIADTAVVGVGCIINAGVIIEPHARIGNHVVIRAGCVVSHDVILEDFVSLSPSATVASRALVKAGGVIYTGAILTPDVVIGEKGIVGAGAIVRKNVAPGATVAGIAERQLIKPVGPPPRQ